MKRNRLLIALLLGFAFSSCKKEKDIAASEFHEKLLTKITETKGNVVTITSFSYDEKKRLSAITKGSDVTSYSYTDNQLTTIESTEGTKKTVTEISYVDNYPREGISKVYEAGTLIRTLKSHFSSSLSETSQITVTDNGAPYRKLYYQYDNSNIVEILDLQNRTLTIYDYRFGSKKNVLFNANSRWAFGFEKVDRVSTNEVLREIAEVNNKRHVKNYTYTYDADLFPLAAVITETDPPSLTETKTMVTYTYEVL